MLKNIKFCILLTFISISSVIANYNYINDSIKISLYKKKGNYYENSNLDSALYWYKKALDISYKSNENILVSGFLLKSIPDNISDKNKLIELCELLRIIGVFHHDKSDYNVAIDYYQKSLKIGEQLEIKKIMSPCYFNIGVIHEDLKNYVLAKEYLIKALKIDIEINDTLGQAYNYIHLGIIEKNYNKNNAIVYYNKALFLCEKIKDTIGISSCHNNLSIIYKNDGNYNKASYHINKSLELDKARGDLWGLGYSLYNLASLELQHKKYQKALENVLDCKDIASKVGVLNLEKEASYFASQIFEMLNNQTKALEYFKIGKELEDSIFNIEKNNKLQEIEATFQLEKKELLIDNLNKEKKAQIIENNRQKLIIIFVVIALLFIFIISIILLLLFRNKRLANKILELKNQEILYQKQEIDDSIQYAKRIQQAVLPDLSVIARKNDEAIHSQHSNCFVPRNDAQFETFILFRPKGIVSGDFYWATRVNNWYIACVADCTGHGVPGAFMSMLGVSFLNEIVRKNEVTKANQVLNELRKSVIEALKQTKDAEVLEASGMKDGMDMSLVAIELQVTNYELQIAENENINTLALSEVEMSTHKHINTLKCQWAGANNPLYIASCQESLIDSLDNNSSTHKNINTQTHQLYEIKGDKMPIAIHERMDEFTNHEFELHSGDIIYLMSDGYQDQFGGPKHKKFLSKNLKKLLLANSQKSMSEQKEILEKTLIDWISDGEQIDDITILGIKL